MARRLKLVKGAGPKATLVYGMRIFDADKVETVEDATARLADGSGSRVTMHVIEGTRAQIRKQLMRSVEAFFDLLGEG